MDQHLTPRPSSRHRAALTPAAITPVEVTHRVGDLERATACDALADHFAAGRLDPAELDDRLARAIAARSRDDLAVLFADLGPRRTPGPARESTPGPVPEPVPGSGLVPVLVTVVVLCLLLAGGMLMVLGAVDPALFVGALVGGTATAVAGSCATVLARTTLRRR